MKAQTIIAIMDILEQKEQEAYDSWKQIRWDLEEKYKTEWLDNEITESEKMILSEARTDYDLLQEIREDFENHQW